MATPATFIEQKLYGGEVTVKFYPNSHMYKVTDPVKGLVDQRMKGVTTFLGVKDKSMALVSWATEEAGLHLYDILSRGDSIAMQDVTEAIGKHRQIKDDAAETGKKAHEWCEYFIKHKLGEPGYEEKPVLPTEPVQLRAVDSFLEFYGAHDIRFLMSERLVYSREHGYVGTVDFAAMVDGVPTVGDFKTSNGLYNSVLLQIAAYQYALEEEALVTKADRTGSEPMEYINRMAVRLSKESEDEYNTRMDRKRIIKGQPDKEMPPYIPFEWRIFPGREDYTRDMQVFLALKATYDWDQQTDFYRNK